MGTGMQRILIGLCSLIFFIALANISFKQARANTHFYKAQNHLITKPGYIPNNDRVKIAKEEISKALKLAPTNANNLDLSGRINYLLAQYIAQGEQRAAILQEAKYHHLKALEQRQLWSYSHVNILYTKSALGEYDADFSEHFSTALKLGVDDKNVIRDLVYIGVASWKNLTLKSKGETAKLTEAALKSGILTKRSFRPYLENLNQLHRICAHLRQFDEKTQLCNS